MLKFNSKNFDKHIQAHFPYKGMRQQQQEIFNKLKLCDDKKYIVIEAPPGTGKSAIAYTISSYFDNAYILTATKQLQMQYQDELKNNIAVMKGAANYTCIYDDTPCNLTICSDHNVSRRACQSEGKCPYYNAKRIASKSEITCVNYAYAFTFMDNLTTTKYDLFCPRDIIVLDECHMLESMLADKASITLRRDELTSQYMLFDDDVLDVYKRNNDIDDLSAMMQWDDDFLNNNEQDRIDEYLHRIYALMTIRGAVWYYMLDCGAEEILDSADRKTFFATDLPEDLNVQEPQNVYERKKIVNRINNLKIIMSKLQYFFSHRYDANWIFSNIGGNQGINIQPMYVKDLFKTYIDRWAKKHFIFMSATILNARIFCQELGIEQDEVAIIRVGSSFDPSKSPIYYTPVGKMNYNSLDKTLPKIVKEVQSILAAYKNKRGIIHTGNYRIAQYICDTIRSNRLLMKRGRDTNETLLYKHKRKKDSVLVSPSLGTGTDLHDDLSEFQIIVKLPFMSLGDARVKRKIRADVGWYECSMFRNLIQASGRSTRSVNDHSDTYILDASFQYYINKYNNWLPEHFTKRIVW